MIVASINAFVLVLIVPDGYFANAYLDDFASKLLIATLVTTAAWVVGTLLTRPESEEVLSNFAEKIRPDLGWRKFRVDTSGQFGSSIVSVFLGCIAVYSALFAIGNLIYGDYLFFSVLLGIFVVAVYIIFKLWNKR